MAGGQSARSGAGENMDAFMARRRQETALSGSNAKTAHDDYGRSIRAGEDLDLRQPGDLASHGSQLTNANSSAQPSPAQNPVPSPTTQSGHVGHPGFAESLIPVWGSGREAVADFQDGDYLGAALNGGLAASDLFLAGDIAKAVGKGGRYMITGAIKDAAKADWKRNVRPELGRLGVLSKWQHGHHWLIPQAKKEFPAVIRNHPLNVKAMPSPEQHLRITGRYKGKPRFNPAQRYWSVRRPGRK